MIRRRNRLGLAAFAALAVVVSVGSGTSAADDSPLLRGLPSRVRPRIVTATFEDRDGGFPSQGDRIFLVLDRQASSVLGTIPARDWIELPVPSDRLGEGALLVRGLGRTAMILLGRDPALHIAGVYRSSRHAVGAPSGIKIRQGPRESVAATRDIGGDGPRGFENRFGMKFMPIPAGVFKMGSPATEEGHEHVETLHEVTLTKDFYMGATEVTNEQFRRFRPGHRSSSQSSPRDPNVPSDYNLNGNTQPAVNVSWENARAFAEWLGEQEGDKTLYRLPTEAEWEYACRAGTSGRFFWGEDENLAALHANGLDPVTKRLFGWEKESFPNDDGHRVAAPVGAYLPNAFGLHDMIGNVGEWCSDWSATA